jgi:CBS domain-containing protein
MYDFLRYRVRDAMTRKPVTVDGSTSLRTLERIFSERDFNGVPVVDADDRLLGVATKIDILRAFTFSQDAIVPPYESIMERTVGEVMTREPVTVDPELPLTRMLQRMVELGNKSFPVVDGDRVVGMIAREDLLAALRRATGGPAPARADSPDRR